MRASHEALETLRLPLGGGATRDSVWRAPGGPLLVLLLLGSAMLAVLTGFLPVPGAARAAGVVAFLVAGAAIARRAWVRARSVPPGRVADRRSARRSSRRSPSLGRSRRFQRTAGGDGLRQRRPRDPAPGADDAARRALRRRACPRLCRCGSRPHHHRAGHHGGRRRAPGGSPGWLTASDAERLVVALAERSPGRSSASTCRRRRANRWSSTAPSSASGRSASI